jgi:hypothetical protein
MKVFRILKSATNAAVFCAVIIFHHSSTLPNGGRLSLSTSAGFYQQRVYVRIVCGRSRWSISIICRKGDPMAKFRTSKVGSFKKDKSFSKRKFEYQSQKSLSEKIEEIKSKKGKNA